MSETHNLNIVNEMVSGPTLRSHMRSVENKSPTSIFKRAVVVDVIFDPSLMNPQEIDRLSGENFEAGKVKAPRGTSDKVAGGARVENDNTQKKGSVSYKEFLKDAPRNSIIARVVSMGEDKTSTSNVVCYPFFPPNICLPVKAGEQVWVMFESPDVKNTKGFWVCRITEPDFVDDVNYTHGDRKFQKNAPKKTSDKNGSTETVAAPGFFNGDPDGKNGETLHARNDKEDPFNDIYKESSANKAFTMEPVPRYTKRPGDLILQGSNNTLVALGQDRGWNKESRPSSQQNSSASSAPPPDFSGTIDIVAGRGRFQPGHLESGLPSVDTMPRAILNTKGVYEVDKNPVAQGSTKAKTNSTDNPVEGDPDFVHDASRLYVSMKTSGDKNFSTQDSLSDFMKQDFSVTDVDDAPFIITKSNEIRIISRYTPNDGVRLEEKGSIRIIREDGDGKKICSLIMTHDGNILIDAEKIVIGDGRSNQIFLGNKAVEPAVLGDTLVSLLTQFCSTAAGSTNVIGGPIVPLVAACNTLSSQLQSIKSSVTKVK